MTNEDFKFFIAGKEIEPIKEAEVVFDMNNFHQDEERQKKSFWFS